MQTLPLHASVVHYQHCACVSDLVFVVGGFEEDRATRGPQVKYPTGSLGAHHACWPLFSWGTCWPWYLRHRRPRCIAPYGKAWTSTRLRRTTSRASRRRGHPRASVRFVGGVSNNASVTQKARHIVCASCVYMCKLIVCKLIVHCAS